MLIITKLQTNVKQCNEDELRTFVILKVNLTVKSRFSAKTPFWPFSNPTITVTHQTRYFVRHLISDTNH